MGYVEIDPETGEGVLIPDPNMDGPNDHLPSLPGLDPHDGDLPGLDLPGGGSGLFDGIDQLTHNLNDTVPGGGDGETPPELWLAGPQGTEEDPAADTSHHGFD